MFIIKFLALDSVNDSRLSAIIPEISMSYRRGRRGDLMVCELVFPSSVLGLSPGRGLCVVFLGETLYFHNGYLRSMKMDTANLMQG